MAAAFVTVGTTKFEQLTEEIQSARVLKVELLLFRWHLTQQQALAAAGFSTLIVQYGAAKHIDSCRKHGVDIIAYDYKPSLAEDMASAQLVIGHAGNRKQVRTIR